MRGLRPSRRGSRAWPVLAQALVAAALASGCAQAPLPGPEALSGGEPRDAPVEHWPRSEVVAPAAGQNAAVGQAPVPAGTEAAPSPPPTAAATDSASAGAVAPVEPDPATPTAAPSPRARLDPEQDAERADLWQRIRAGLAIPDLDGDLVRRWERHYAGQPEYLQRMVERGARYLFHIVEEVDRREMPQELALLPFVESAFNPVALSRAKAAGMWQFMPGTGRQFDLQQNIFRDERLDVLASTRAALDFLGALHARFGDWQLALAAYNWGPGNVVRALERNRRAGKPLTFSALQRVPAETRNYVPKLQALKNIVLRPAAYDVELAKLENHPYFLSVAIERDIDVDLAAGLAGLPLEEFRQLNPQHNRAVILAAGTPHVLLPYDNANQFVRALAEPRAALASWTAWTAPRTLKTAEAAKLVGMAETELASVNHIPPRMLIRAGSTLIVPRAAGVSGDVSGQLADRATLTLTPEGQHGARQTTLRAGPKGDTVVAVARRHGLAAAQVAQWNRVAANATFAPGQPIVLVLPPRQRVVVAGSPAAGAKPAAPAKAPRGPAAPGGSSPRVKVAERR
ncbi:MAG: transglycosylase SLT domain-containing protein [Rubrivivax sp.]|nr:transglycosylase SLT domain-containing protein [Rubrivivax sp.]